MLIDIERAIVQNVQTLNIICEVVDDWVTENISERIEGTGSESRNSQFGTLEIEKQQFNNKKCWII